MGIWTAQTPSDRQAKTLSCHKLCVRVAPESNNGNSAHSVCSTWFIYMPYISKSFKSIDHPASLQAAISMWNIVLILCFLSYALAHFRLAMESPSEWAGICVEQSHFPPHKLDYTYGAHAYRIRWWKKFPFFLDSLHLARRIVCFQNATNSRHRFDL